MCGSRDAQPRSGGIIHPHPCLPQGGTGWGRAGCSQATSIPNFVLLCGSRVAAECSSDTQLQAQHQEGQSDAWLLHLPSVPALQHLSPPLAAQLSSAPEPFRSPGSSPGNSSGTEKRGARLQKKHQMYQAVKTSPATVQEGTGLYNMIYTVHTERKNILLTAKCFTC